MKRAWKTKVCLLMVLCMAALFLPQSLAAEEQQPGSPTDDQPETVSPAAAAAPLQRNAGSTTLAYDPAEYSQNDVNVINAIIENNGLNADKDSPAAWGFVTWSADSPKRITELGIDDVGLVGNLDVRGLTALTYLDCSSNQLATLDVSGLTSLTTLECHINQLTSLNLEGLTALTNLWCSYNILADLDVSSLTELKELHCGGNKLTGLDVSALTKLTLLGCYNNQLPSLDVSNLTALTGLSCESNQLTELKVSGLTRLKELNCADNQLNELDVSGLTSLLSLKCGSNDIASLDLRGLSAIRVNNCNVTELIDPLGKTMTCSETDEGFAQILQYNQNGSKEVEIQAYPKTGYVFQKWDNETTDNPYTFELNSGTIRTPVFAAEAEPRYNQEDMAALEKFIADYQFNGRRGVRLGYPDTYSMAEWQDDGTAPTGKRLIGLSIWNSKLPDTTIEVTGFTALTVFRCGNNELTSLTVSDLPNLDALICNYNQLTSLEMNNLPALTVLQCADNQLTSLDASSLNQLWDLSCNNNPLSSLKLPGEKSIQINVTKGKGQPWLKDFNFDEGVLTGTYGAEGAPGYGNPAWEDPVGCAVAAGGELTFDFGNNEGVSAVSANLSFERTEALEADPEKGKIEGKGVAPGDNVKQGDTFTFTANPITTGEGEAFPGDTQYMPESWSVNPSGDFTTGPTQSFSTKDMALGEHTLTVEYRKERYDGRNWVYVDEKIQKTFAFTLVGKSTSGGNTTGGGQTVSQPGTNTDVSSGNPGTGDPLAVGWLVVAGMSALGAGVMLRKQQKKA